jgi:hypothetical protein
VGILRHLARIQVEIQQFGSSKRIELCFPSPCSFLFSSISTCNLS